MTPRLLHRAPADLAAPPSSAPHRVSPSRARHLAGPPPALAPWWRPDILVALLLVYALWSTTYLAMKVGLAAFPPFFLTGGRCIGAGLLLYAGLRLGARHPAPPPAAWWRAGIVGVLLMGGGTGGICYALQYVSTGTAAVMIGAVPLWATLFAMLLWRYRPGGLEAVGLAVGFSGVVLLAGELGGEPLGVVAMVAAAVSWAFGSMLGRRLGVAPGLMAVAVELMLGGAALVALSPLAGEAMARTPGWREWGAFLYLMLLGMLVGFSAYMYLLERTSPAVATSYAFVNPVLTVWLGWWLLDEAVSHRSMFASAIIIASVILVARTRRHVAAHLPTAAPAETEMPPPGEAPSSGPSGVERDGR